LRSAPYLRVCRRGRWTQPSDHRQAAGPHADAHDAAVCPHCRRSAEGSGAQGGHRHRGQWHCGGRTAAGQAVMNKRWATDRRLIKALAVLDPPELERETCRKQIEKVLDLWEFLTEPERDELEIGLHSKQGKAALKRYVTALRKVKVCYAALNPSIQRFLAIEAEAIVHDIAEPTAMSVPTDKVQRVRGKMRYHP